MTELECIWPVILTGECPNNISSPVLTCQLIYLKHRDITESRYGQNILSRYSSQRLAQADDRGMRDGKGVHTIRDSCYHREKGAEKT